MAFDKVYVVTHPAHIVRYERELDSRVGLMILSDQHALTPYREASSNIDNIDPLTIFRCMRRAEYLSAIKSTIGAVPIMPNGLIGAYCETLFKQLSKEQAHRCFVKAIKARTTDKSNVDFVSKLPSSLRALGYATPLSGRQRISVLDSLSKPVTCPIKVRIFGGDYLPLPETVNVFSIRFWARVGITRHSQQ